MDRDTFHQTRLLKAPSSLALNTAREGAASACPPPPPAPAQLNVVEEQLWLLHQPDDQDYASPS